MLLVGVPRVYSCGSCRAHVASDLDVVSRVGVGGCFGGLTASLCVFYESRHVFQHI